MTRRCDEGEDYEDEDSGFNEVFVGFCEDEWLEDHNNRQCGGCVYPVEECDCEWDDSED